MLTFARFCPPRLQAAFISALLVITALPAYLAACVIVY